MEKFSLFSYTEEDKARVLSEYGYTESSMKEDIDVIMDWFQKQPHLVEGGIDPDMIEKLLIMSKGSREKTKQRIDKLYKYKAMSPDLIESRKEILSSNNHIWTFYRQAITRKKMDCKRLTVIQFTDPDPSSFCTEEIFRNSYMIGDLRVKFDYMLGEIWLIDFKNVTLGHFLRLKPMVVQRAAQMFQEGLSLKVYAIHVLNVPAVGENILNFFKKFLKAKILDRLTVHANLEDLHEALPKQYLPRDYGGEDLSMEEFREMYEKEFRSKQTKEYLLKGCEQISDEKKRPDVRVGASEEFLAGSFKKLDID